MTRRVVIATHNPGKLREIAQLLEPYGVEAVSAAALGLPEPEENGATFAANAVLKAEAAAESSGLPALADDSGFCVSALGGLPGVHSARWAGPARDFGLAMRRVRREVGDNPDRRAWFICALAYAEPGKVTQVFEGRIDGEILFPPRGTRGFGYDPIFLPDGQVVTFGEMDPQRKNAMSHRARAFEQLVKAVFSPSPLAGEGLG
ncbi:MAG TPA: RdgB/HAM1 family non-canonical purine NTP pyrophosphatase [Kiloniellales bacterium]|nr:RdgB/HAM1 family non-canonical purine NTP pyrophosphatase [Kiloniellales bacterium]